MEKILERLRYLAVAVLSSVIVLVAIQNLNSVEVKFLAWRLEANVALLTLVPFLGGLLIGIWASVLGLWRRRRQRAAAEEAEAEAVPEAELLGEGESVPGGELGEGAEAGEVER